MKTITFKCYVFLCLLVTISITSRAQSPGGSRGDFPPSGFSEVKRETPDETAKRETKWMKRKLKLTSEQLAQVEDLTFDNASKKQEFIDNMMKKGSRPTKEQMALSQKNFDELAEEKDSNLSRILTEKQWQTYLSNKKQLEDTNQNMPSGGPEGRGGRSFPPN